MKVPTQCNECGSKSLTWQTTNTTTSGVQNGRLRLNEVQCQFVLGCDDCSATLKTASADKIAAMLTLAQEQAK